MATRNLYTRDLLRQFRVFTVTYYCDDCGNEFTDQMMAVSHSWCPCCDAKVQPGTIEEHEEDAGDEETEQ